MKKIISVMVVFVLCHVSVAFALNDGEFSLGQVHCVNWKIHDNWSASLVQEIYYRDSGRDFYQHQYDVSLSYTGIADWLNVAIRYQWVDKKSNDEWNWTGIFYPYAVTTWKKPLGEFEFVQNNKLEYLGVEGGADGWRYKNKITLNGPKLTKFEITPFIADEVRYSFITEKLDYNEVYGGIRFNINKNLTMLMLYLHANSKSGDKWIQNGTFKYVLVLNF